VRIEAIERGPLMRR